MKTSITCHKLLCKLFYHPNWKTLVQRQLASGKYQTALEVILAGVKLLEGQEDIYQGRQELQQEAQIRWEAAQRGELIDGATAMGQIRTDLTRYAADL